MSSSSGGSRTGRPAAVSGAGHRRRLRERFLRGGLDALADHEAIELLLTYAIARRDVKPLAKTLLDRFGSVEKLLDASGAELAEVEGVGAASGVLILLIKSLCAKYLEQRARGVDLLDSPARVTDFIRMKLGGGRKETLMVIYLDSRHQLIAFDCYPGTVDRAAIFTREVVERALLRGASGVILAHNHPSGVCEPSPEDIALTRAVRQGLASLAIPLYDHLIVTPSACRRLD